MARQTLTPAEDRLYTHILGFAADHDGRAPTLPELAERFDISKSGVSTLVTRIVKKGWLKFEVKQYRIVVPS